MTKGSNNPFPSALFDEQVSAPATPAAGFWRVYFKSDGIYVVDDAGAETGPLSSSAGVAGLVLLDTQAVAGSPGVITFTSIPTGYKDLLFTGRIRGAHTGAATDGLHVRMGAGSLDTGSNYAYQVAWRGTSATNANSAAAAQLVGGIIPTNNEADSNDFASVEMTLFDYLETAYHRTVLFRVAHASSDFRSTEGGGRWKNAASAVDTVSFFGNATANLAIGSKIRMYGLR